MPATQGHSPNMTWCDQLFLTFDVHLLPQVYHCHAPKKTQTRVTFTELIGKLKEKIAEICVAKSVHQCFIIQKSYLFSVSDYPARTPSILIVDQVTSHLGDGLEIGMGGNFPSRNFLVNFTKVSVRQNRHFVIVILSRGLMILDTSYPQFGLTFKRNTSMKT